MYLWDVATGKCVRMYEGHTQKITAVCMSADNRWVISAQDDTIRLWDVATGECVRVFDEYDAEYEYLDTLYFSFDGRLAISGGSDIRLWDIASGRCIQVLQGRGKSLEEPVMSQDCKWLVSRYSDRSVMRWRLDWKIVTHVPEDWDEGARSYLVDYLTQRTPYAAEIPITLEPSEEDMVMAVMRRGRPVWTEEDFMAFLDTLANVGYGWLRPEGVRRELEKMARKWDGPPPLFSQNRALV